MAITKPLSFKIKSNRKISFTMKFKKKKSVKGKFHYQHFISCRKKLKPEDKNRNLHEMYFYFYQSFGAKFVKMVY